MQKDNTKNILVLLTGLLLSILIPSGCKPATSNRTKDPGDTSTTSKNIVVQPAMLFTLPDGEKILGEPAQLTDSSTTSENGRTTYQCSFTAKNKDEKSDKLGVVYFLLLEYPSDSIANREYTDVYESNKNNGGVEVLKDLGDEAYFHSDDENFYFIQVRKGKKIFRIKVNKITGNTSLDDFNRVSKEIAGKL